MALSKKDQTELAPQWAAAFSRWYPNADKYHILASGKVKKLRSTMEYNPMTGEKLTYRVPIFKPVTFTIGSCQYTIGCHPDHLIYFAYRTGLNVKEALENYHRTESQSLAA